VVGAHSGVDEAPQAEGPARAQSSRPRVSDLLFDARLLRRPAFGSLSVCSWNPVSFPRHPLASSSDIVVVRSRPTHMGRVSGWGYRDEPVAQEARMARGANMPG
jgi:hypothetical protein